FNIDLLNQSFHEFGTAHIGDGTPDPSHPLGYPAFWTVSTSGLTDTLGLTGRQIYFWAFDAPTLGAATQQGIFTSTDPSWIFSSSSSIPPPNININLEQVA